MELASSPTPISRRFVPSLSPFPQKVNLYWRWYRLCLAWECPRHCSWSRRSRRVEVGRSWRKLRTWFHRWCYRGNTFQSPGRHGCRTVGRSRHRSQSWTQTRSERTEIVTTQSSELYNLKHSKSVAMGLGTAAPPQKKSIPPKKLWLVTCLKHSS